MASASIHYRIGRNERRIWGRCAGAIVNLRDTVARQLVRRRFAREVLTLQSGSFAAFGIQVLTSVIIANELGVSRYGTFALARNLVDIVGSVAGLAVGQALVTRLTTAVSKGDKDEAASLIGYSLKVGLLIGLVQAAVGLMGADWLSSLLGYDPQIGVLAKLLFLIPVFSVAFNSVVLMLQSSRQAARLTLLESGTLVGTSVMNATAVALGTGLQGMVYTTALGPLLASIASLLLYRAVWTQIGLPDPASILRATLTISVRKYFSFSAWVSADKSFANLIALAPTTLLGMLSTEAEVAYFRLGYRLMDFLSIPLSPIARNLYAALAQVASKEKPRALGKALAQATAVGGVVSVVGTGAMMLTSPYILLLYSPEYAPVQSVMYALGLRFALLGFGVGLGPIYQVLDAMKIAILTKVVPALIMLGVGWMVIGQYGAVGAAISLVTAYLVGDLVNLLLVPWLMRRRLVPR